MLMEEPGLGGTGSIVVLDLYLIDHKVPGRWQIVCPFGSLYNHYLEW